MLGGAAERLRERIAMRPHPAYARIRKTHLERARAQMSGMAFEDSWNEGRRMALESAVDMALKAESNTNL
jgi:hypothetical protein